VPKIKKIVVALGFQSISEIETTKTINQLKVNLTLKQNIQFVIKSKTTKRGSDGVDK
jgi:hypothetical protein